MRIAVIHHIRDDFAGMAYAIHLLIAAWRAAGHGVVVSDNPRRAEGADVVCPHVDLTVVPPGLRRALARHPCVVNRGLWDISKRRISTNLVVPGDGWTGPVIAKADLNCAGAPERIHQARGPGLARALCALGRRLPGGARRFAADLGPYRVYARVQDVPAAIWRERAWVVERFLPERAGDSYVVRQIWLLGDRHFHVVARYDQPIGKGRNALDWHVTHDALPADIARYCGEAGVDYAKIDFAMVDGRAVVFDVNRTPVSDILQAACPQELADLASGLAAVAARRSDRR